MTAFLLRGLRLLRSNPRLFFRRAGLLLRRPLRNGRAFIAQGALDRKVAIAYREWLAGLSPEPIEATDTTGPLLSVIMPVYDVEPALLEDAIESVVGQHYPHWELCIADDASPSIRVRTLLEQYAARDTRIRVTYRERSGHIAAASNSAIAGASGEFIILLDHDDVLAPEALLAIAAVTRDYPGVDLLYSDEDKIDPQGRRVQPFFKPAWSPTLLTGCNYITHVAALRRSLVLEVGGFRDETVGSQDHDLFLRVCERAREVAHIPQVLYSWRMSPGSTARASSAKPYAIGAARRALSDAVRRRDLAAEVRETHLNGIFMLRYALSLPVSASLVIHGHGTGWREVLKLDGLDIRDGVYLDEPLEPLPGIVVVPSVDQLTGEYLMFLDASSRPRKRDSVLGLFEHMQNPSVAAVGGLTSYRGTVQQAGVTIGDKGQPVFAGQNLYLLPYRTFYVNLKELAREVSAVWVGCCLIRQKVWQELGGWRDGLSPELAMVDLCLRAQDAGYGAVYTPIAHFTASGPLPAMPRVPSEQWPWRDFLDPFWNPTMDPATPGGFPFRHSPIRARVRPGGVSVV